MAWRSWVVLRGVVGASSPTDEWPSFSPAGLPRLYYLAMALERLEEAGLSRLGQPARAATAALVEGEVTTRDDRSAAAREPHRRAAAHGSLAAADVLEISGDLDQEALQSFRDKVSNALGNVIVKVASSPSSADACGPLVDEASCLEALEAESATSAATSASSEPVFELVLVRVQEGNTLILSAGRRAYLRFSSVPFGELAASTASLLKESWFRRASLLEGGASLFEITPAYVFSFFLLGDCHSRVSWDFFGAVLAPYLSRLLGKLQLLFGIEWNSQVVLCGSLGTSLEPAEWNRSRNSSNVVDVSVLQADFMRRTGEWPPDALTRDVRWLPPLVRFVAFKPMAEHELRLVDEKGDSQHSFAVQGFGAVAIARCKDVPEPGSNGSLSDCEAQQVASGWISSVRSWLSLPADGSVASSNGASVKLRAARPRVDGIADWELQILARAIHAHFIQRTAETLQSLVELVESLPDVVVRQEIGAMAFQAVNKAWSSNHAAERGDLRNALAESREALILALTAIHDDSVVSQLYFSWEFKYAVYLPISMPVAVPLLTSSWRHFKSLLGRPG
ncbi:unnamed protein product [Durusdinium trenchii]|uniref:Uncharacterized protein n=1 Tax=Durusdinium trenchii TaxID=1381693 RepID=A0ABP0MZZ5_9DINO